jgi:hypothetical protein
MEAAMNQTGTITMRMREFDRFKVIQAVVDGDIKSGRAAERLGLTVRQVRRLACRFRADGPPWTASHGDRPIDAARRTIDHIHAARFQLPSKHQRVFNLPASICFRWRQLENFGLFIIATIPRACISKSSGGPDEFLPAEPLNSENI